MNNIFLNILFSLVITIITSCSDFSGDEINAKKNIEKYNLKLIKDINEIKNTPNIDLNLFSTVYGNLQTDSCLIIIVKNHNDTLIKQFDKGVHKYYFSNIIKKYNDYFLVLENIESPNYHSNLYGLNIKQTKAIPNYYRIDTIEKKLQRINLISKDSIIALAKATLRSEDSLYIYGNILYDKFYLAKDTLKNYQRLYYIITNGFELKSNKHGYLLYPKKIIPFNINKKFVDRYLYKNKINIQEFYCCSTLERIPENVYSSDNKYHFYFRVYSRLSNDLNSKIIKSELILQERYLNKKRKTKKILKVFDKDPIYNYSNLIKYQNQEYFIGVFPQVELDEYKNSVFHLDTIKWELNPVTVYDQNIDGNFKTLKKGKNSFITGDVGGNISGFLNDFKIVTVKNEYRLIKKDN